MAAAVVVAALVNVDAACVNLFVSVDTFAGVGAVSVDAFLCPVTTVETEVAFVEVDAFATFHAETMIAGAFVITDSVDAYGVAVA